MGKNFTAPRAQVQRSPCAPRCLISCGTELSPPDTPTVAVAVGRSLGTDTGTSGGRSCRKTRGSIFAAIWKRAHSQREPRQIWMCLPREPGSVNSSQNLRICRMHHKLNRKERQLSWQETHPASFQPLLRLFSEVFLAAVSHQTPQKRSSICFFEWFPSHLLWEPEPTASLEQK